ncbi:hypothetical protein HDV06_001968 [Boothiomyces sp. JEL0866]|nr:hypothetical protein HDV06_001968 [Boothiomyces sp. JEL0866]
MFSSNQKALRVTITTITVLYIVYILDWTSVNSNTNIVEELQSYSYPTPVVEILPNENFPVLDTEYINQNGPLMIQRTLKGNMSQIKIAIDKSLEKEFSFIQPGQCSADCQFYFSNDYAEMADEADGLITDQPNGILVNNAMLHFTKTVYQNVSSKNLRDFKWYGTDIFAGMQPIPRKDDRELYGRPAHLKVHKTLETEQSLGQIVDFKEKQNYIAVFLHPSLCRNDSRNSTVVSFLKELQQKIPIQVVDQQCGFTSTVSCGSSETDCILKSARASLVIDPFDQDSFVVSKFWKSMSYSTPVIYSWSGNFAEYAPNNFFMDMKEFNTNSIVEFVEKFNQEYFNLVFSWKRPGNAIPQEISMMLKDSLPNMPCIICNHIRERKLSTRATLDFVSSSANVSQKVKEHSNVTEQMPGLDAVFVNHYSRATERMENIKKLSKDLGTEVNVVVGFDKEDLVPGWTRLILQNRQTRNNNPFRNSYVNELRPGEVSLSIKSFWVYYQILQNNLNNTLVVEDDVQLNSNSQNISISSLVGKIPSTYSAFQLGQCISHYINTLPQEGISYTGNFKISPNLGDPRHCTSAYIMSKQGAILMFKSLPIAMPIDYQMSGYMPFAEGMTHQGRIDHPNLSIYSLWPAVFEPSVDVNEKSDTGIRD